MYCDADCASTCALARSWLAQITLAASCVTSSPAAITSINRPSSDCGQILPSRSSIRCDARLSMRDADIGREHVAGAAHGLDQGRLLAVVVEAQAQTADLHVQRAVQRAGVAAPGFLAQHAAVQDYARMFDEVLQQLEVQSRQRDDRAGA